MLIILLQYVCVSVVSANFKNMVRVILLFICVYIRMQLKTQYKIRIQIGLAMYKKCYVVFNHYIANVP